MSHTMLGSGTAAATHAIRIQDQANETLWAEASQWFHDVEKADVEVSSAQVRHVLVAAGYSDLLEACELALSELEEFGDWCARELNAYDPDGSRPRRPSETILIRAIAKARGVE